MERILKIVLAATIIFSIYVVWLKWSTSCISCSIGFLGLPVSQFQLAILALIGSSLIAISYYFSRKMQRLQYVTLGFSAVLAAVASFLMILQIKSIICWPCIITDILFYLIFILMFLEQVSRSSRKKIKHGEELRSKF